MTDQPARPTPDESLMAALSHFLGFLVALFIWVTQKDKSRFVRFQSMQAMAFDLVVSVIAVLVVGGMLVLTLGLLAVGIGNIAVLGSQNNPAAEPIRVIVSLMTALPFLIPCIVIPVVLVFFIARLIATIQTFQGKDFHYPWLGDAIERSLEK